MNHWWSYYQKNSTSRTTFKGSFGGMEKCWWGWFEISHGQSLNVQRPPSPPTLVHPPHRQLESLSLSSLESMVIIIWTPGLHNNSNNNGYSYNSNNNGCSNSHKNKNFLSESNLKRKIIWSKDQNTLFWKAASVLWILLLSASVPL